MNKTPRWMSMLIGCNAVALTALAMLLLSGFSRPASRFDEIDVKRINIVDDQGKTIIAISNKARIAGPVAAGKSYPVAVSEGRENMAGMIFFNQDGDEMGGLVFNSYRLPNGKATGIGHLSFDRFNDNQVLALQYKENASGVQSGLTVYDRPGNGNFKASLDLVERMQTATPEQMTAIKREFAALKQANGGLGAERVFVGSRNRDAQLSLKDAEGNVRARLLVDADGQARLEFLDAEGNVRSRFSADDGNVTHQ